MGAPEYDKELQNWIDKLGAPEDKLGPQKINIKSYKNWGPGR